MTDIQKQLAEALGELQALRNHVAHWQRIGIDTAALARADAALAAHRQQEERKPLTREQLVEVYQEASGNVFFSDFERIVRAIEAAHGIKGE